MVSYLLKVILKLIAIVSLIKISKYYHQNDFDPAPIAVNEKASFNSLCESDATSSLQ